MESKTPEVTAVTSIETIAFSAYLLEKGQRSFHAWWKENDMEAIVLNVLKDHSAQENASLVEQLKVANEEIRKQKSSRELLAAAIQVDGMTIKSQEKEIDKLKAVVNSHVITIQLRNKEIERLEAAVKALTHL